MGSSRAAGIISARVPDALTALLLAVLAAVVSYNAFHYPAVSGFDAEVDLEYAHTLLTEWRIPAELRNNYTPPLFFLVAGPFVELGGSLGLADPADLAQLLVGALTVGTALLLVALCALLFPGRPWLRLAAVGLFVASPTVLKLGAMFHPQPLAAFLATLASVLVARMIARRRYGLGAALALGAVTGAGQLVRSVGIWVLAVACLSLLLAAVVGAGDRPSALRALVVTGVVGVGLALPWYLVLEPDNARPLFVRAHATAGSVPSPTVRATASLNPLSVSTEPDATTSRSLWFYLDPGLPEVLTAPHRGAVTQRFWPILYTDHWGDFWGNWSWNAQYRPLTQPIERRLQVQSFMGLLPTFLAAVGLVALIGLAFARLRERTELVVAPLTVLVALLAGIYYAYAHPARDSDTVKALFLLPAMPALALCFGFALETLGRRSRVLGAVLGTACTAVLAVSLVFGIA